MLMALLQYLISGQATCRLFAFKLTAFSISRASAIGDKAESVAAGQIELA